MGKLTVLPKALLFDLDGTLANTIPQLATEGDSSSGAIGLNPPSVETTKGFVGNGVNMLLARVIAGRFDVELKDVDPSLLKRARGTRVSHPRRIIQASMVRQSIQ